MEPPAPPTLTAPAKSGLAKAGLICGILSPFTCLATALPAIIMGHIALSRANSSGGTRTGSKPAIWALVLGYGSFILIPVIAALAGLTAPLVLKKVNDGKLTAISANVRQIGFALSEYNLEHGTDTAPYPSDIRQLDSIGITTNIDTLLAIPPSPSGTAGEWLYFSAADSENPAAPLLISPPLSQKSVVLKVDLSVTTLRQSDVDALVKSSPVPPDKIPAPVRTK